MGDAPQKKNYLSFTLSIVEVYFSKSSLSFFLNTQPLPTLPKHTPSPSTEKKVETPHTNSRPPPIQLRFTKDSKEKGALG